MMRPRLLLTSLGAGAAFLAATEAAALSCARPDWALREAEVVVTGRMGPPSLVRTYTTTPWATNKKVQVRELASPVTVVKTLRGSGAPARFTYKFRDKQIDCDFAPPAVPGQQAVFALKRDTRTGEWWISMHTPADWARAKAQRAR
jgi:hypothetical protein